MLKRVKNFSQCSPWSLIVAAAVLHLSLTISIYVCGRLAISPMFNENGVAATLAPDSLEYLSQTRSLAETLSQRGVSAWLSATDNLHLRLYSLSFFIFPLGTNILSAEPLNLCFYLAILFLVFKIGEEVFERPVGMIAAGLVGLWPSFILHTTQILKDPMFTTMILVLCLIIVDWLVKALPWRRALILGTAGVATVGVLCFARSGLWGALLLPITIIGVCLLGIRQWREKRLLAANLVCAVVVLAASIVVPAITKEAGGYRSQMRKMEARAGSESINKLDLIAVWIWRLREGFNSSYDNPGSNIDVDIKFSSAADLFRYLPRAIEIGGLAPFPNMWLKNGNQLGLLGRALSGLEMLVMYVVELLALFGLWRSRTRLSAWLLSGVALIGITALGLVVVNVGALYRMRYTFFILLIILGMNGLMQVLYIWKNKGLLDKASVPVSVSG